MNMNGSSGSMVRRWAQRFREGKEYVSADTRSDRQISVLTNEILSSFDNLLEMIHTQRPAMRHGLSQTDRPKIKHFHLSL